LRLGYNRRCGFKRTGHPRESHVDTVTITLLVAMFGVAVLVLREPFCWYFKINQTLDNQRKILAKLQAQSGDTKA
jgi:hypothetical protein